MNLTKGGKGICRHPILKSGIIYPNLSGIQSSSYKYNLNIKWDNSSESVWNTELKLQIHVCTKSLAIYSKYDSISPIFFSVAIKAFLVHVNPYQ